MVPKICLDGGPCGGKTSALAHLVEKLSQRGHHPIVVPEAATLLMNGNVSPRHWSTLDFQAAVIGTAKHLEDIAMRLAKSVKDRNPVILCDRGIASSAAYVDDVSVYVEALKQNGIHGPVPARDNYTGVYHLTTAADGAEEFYTLANNTARSETPEEARALDNRTRKAWVGTLHWREIDNSTDFPGKLARLDHEVCSLLGIPVPIELECKFLCTPTDHLKLPEHAQEIEIEQIYLRSHDPAVVSRIRRRGQNGSYLYFRTDKKYLGPGKNEEVERIISAREYYADKELRDPSKNILRKIRTCFVYDRQYFELDRIPLRDGTVIHLLEIEITNELQGIRLPPFLHIIKDVTGDPAFTNVMVAERV